MAKRQRERWTQREGKKQIETEGEGERAEGDKDPEKVRQKKWTEQRTYPEKQAQGERDTEKARGLTHTDMTPTSTLSLIHI